MSLQKLSWTALASQKPLKTNGLTFAQGADLRGRLCLFQVKGLAGLILLFITAVIPSGWLGGLWF